MPNSTIICTTKILKAISVDGVASCPQGTPELHSGTFLLHGTYVGVNVLKIFKANLQISDTNFSWLPLGPVVRVKELREKHLTTQNQ